MIRNHLVSYVPKIPHADEQIKPRIFNRCIQLSKEKKLKFLKKITAELELEKIYLMLSSQTK